ncbi:MAG TPA: U32 family peptidase [Candidatus Onthousia faecigallinarum]|nr:U32 family peptidase [Candidatus Onthousia faecigallinarum]
MKRVELLAPAGDLERLKVTLLYGADAVYVGGSKLGLRANATNFNLEELKEGCSFAHSLNKKVYLTVNIVFHEEDYMGMEEYLEEVCACGIDGVIVSDPYVICYMVEHYPKVECHLSTQASVMNYEAALFYRSLGVKRIVLAREVGKDDIQEIIEKSGVDVEVFLHGAMCTCVSGRCALSNYVTNRDANRGGCAQVCRFAFESEEGPFTMASKDLNLSCYIPLLIETGVTSLKVEGRMRSLYYLATVIGSYRALIDAYYKGELTESFALKYQKILSRVANRESTSQFFLKEAGKQDQYYTGRQELSNQDYLGLIFGYDDEMKCFLMRERNYFKVGDSVEVFTPKGEIYSFEVDSIYDEENHSLEVARHPEQILKIPFDHGLPEYSMMRKRVEV